jgi:cell division protein FtsW (lipid II flippase)
MATRADERAVARMAGPWWLFLVTGIAWLILAKIVLDADWGTVAAISGMAGFLFIAAGVNEFVIAGGSPAGDGCTPSSGSSSSWLACSPSFGRKRRS